MKRIFLYVLVLSTLWMGLAQAQSYRIMAPCTTGCSWDVLAKAISETLKAEGLASSVEVYNVPGQGGAVGLQQFAKLQGDATQLFAFGVGAVGGTILNKSPVTLQGVTPVVRLTADYEVVYVGANTPYRTLNDLLSAFKANPSSITWGGSSAGSTSHMMAGLLAQAAGVDGSKIKFVPSSGNLQGATAAAQGEITAGTGSYASIEELIQNGRIRALGVSSPRRLPGVNIPTLIEQGVQVEFVNWRGIAAPPGLSPRDRFALTNLFSRMVRTPTWQRVMSENRWIPYFQTGETFRTFLEREQETVGSLLKNLDLIR